MSNWKQMSIGDFVDFNPSESLPKGKQAKKIPMAMLTEYVRKIKGFEIAEYNSGPKFRNGDTLVAKITPCLENGKTAQVDILENDEVAFGSSEFIVLRENQYSINDYIYYLAKSPVFRERAISCMEGTSGRKRVNEGALKRQEIIVPNKNTQQKIAKVLSDLDAKIELNNKINTELEAMAKTLYDYWFVQFDFPDKNGKPYKSSGGKMVWNEELKREIPEGWDVKKIGKVLKTHLGGTPSTKVENYWQGNIPWMNSGEVANFPLINTDQKISQEAIDNSSTKLLKEGSVLLSITRHLRVNVLGIDACINQSIAGIEENGIFKKSYIYFSVLNDIDRLMSLRTGAQQPHINKEIVDSSPFIVPKTEVLKEYNKKASPIFEKIINNAKQNQELASLRDWLLPMLMNGQVTVVSTSSASKESYVIEDRILKMVAEPEIKILSLQEKKLRRKMLATFIVNQSLSDTRFGKTKFEKLLHLIEYHIVKDDFNQKYSVQTAGPYDGGFTKLYWDEVLKAKWFKIEELGNLKRIVAGENHSKSLVEYNYFSEELKESISQFISLFKSKNYEKAEIVSTLFAVWNNRIIKNEMVTDTLLKKDFLEWDKQKSKYAVHLDNALAWMRKENVIPDGWGKYINRAKGK